jgi:hypothetical protein
LDKTLPPSFLKRQSIDRTAVWKEGNITWGAIQVPLKKREVEKLKFIAFYKWKPEDMDKVLERKAQTSAIREKDPERFPKVIFGPFTMGGEAKSFVVYETDNPDQLWNIALHYTPLVKWKFVPIQESAKNVELYQKMKK